MRRLAPPDRTRDRSSEASDGDKGKRENRGDEIITTACEEGTLVDLAVSGVGRVVMPTFVANGIPGLTQVAPVIPELSHDEWLVCHHEARHDPPIRAALEAVARLLSQQKTSAG